LPPLGSIEAAVSFQRCRRREAAETLSEPPNGVIKQADVAAVALVDLPRYNRAACAIGWNIVGMMIFPPLKKLSWSRFLGDDGN